METLRNIKIFYTTQAEYNRAENVALWILQILTAAAFLMAGTAKFFGNAAIIEAFADLGLGQWFRYFTGAVEIASAAMLCVPRLILIGAFLLICTMLGAIAAHLFVLGGSPSVPTLLLSACAAILWGRAEQFRR